jgi:hypothetical protein
MVPVKAPSTIPALPRTVKVVLVGREDARVPESSPVVELTVSP